MPAILRTAATQVEAALDDFLPAADAPPARLHAAMRYVVFAGGKRLRPALALAACRATGGSDSAARPAMLALELLHSYTLVHDDLPAMDDDALRRGRPTCHIAFDEATAILVGDALHCAAFQAVAPLGGAAVGRLARAAGSEGVIGGQQEDLDAEAGRQPANPGERAALLERIHCRKTAALLGAACALGAQAAGAPPAQIEVLSAFGTDLGLAFQIVDDLLDGRAEAAVLGKTPGKDAARGKLTWVGLHGVAAAEAAAVRLRDQALERLRVCYGATADLAVLARFIVDRDR